MPGARGTETGTCEGETEVGVFAVVTVTECVYVLADAVGCCAGGWTGEDSCVEDAPFCV